MVLTWVEVREAISIALSVLKSNKLRAGLTILGVMVGVASVIAMASIIGGLDGAIKNQIDTLGTNLIEIDLFPPNTDWDDLSDEERNRPYFTVGEANAILANSKLVSAVSPQNHYWAMGGNVAKYKNRKYNGPRFVGVWPDYARVNNVTISRGRFLSDTDNRFRLMNAVIGHEVADVLFEDFEEPVGSEIRMNGVKLMVVGVMDKIESNFDTHPANESVIIPLATFEKLHPDDKYLSLAVSAVSYEVIDDAIDELTGILRSYRNVPFNKPDNFHLSTQDQYKDLAGDITQYIYIAMFVITSVGLLVGGIGVMNIMLVSVTERTREIGIRKAIGAKRSNILVQFLTEAMTLSGTGGVIGIAVGVGLGLLINSVAGFPLSIPVLWIVIGFVVSVSVGLVSGVYPAMKAANLDPIDALRYE